MVFAKKAEAPECILHGVKKDRRAKDEGGVEKHPEIFPLKIGL